MRQESAPPHERATSSGSRPIVGDGGVPSQIPSSNSDTGCKQPDPPQAPPLSPKDRNSHYDMGVDSITKTEIGNLVKSLPSLAALGDPSRQLSSETLQGISSANDVLAALNIPRVHEHPPMLQQSPSAVSLSPECLAVSSVNVVPESNTVGIGGIPPSQSWVCDGHEEEGHEETSPLSALAARTHPFETRRTHIHVLERPPTQRRTRPKSAPPAPLRSRPQPFLWESEWVTFFRQEGIRRPSAGPPSSMLTKSALDLDRPALVWMVVLTDIKWNLLVESGVAPPPPLPPGWPTTVLRLEACRHRSDVPKEKVCGALCRSTRGALLPLHRHQGLRDSSSTGSSQGTGSLCSSRNSVRHGSLGGRRNFFSLNSARPTAATVFEMH